MITEILPNTLYLGGFEDSKTFTGIIINVKETIDGDFIPSTLWLPIMIGERINDFYADTYMLNAVAVVAHSYIMRGEKVLIHCGHGIERSPLAVAWYLKKFGGYRTINSAYNYICKLRPQIQRRIHWLNKPRLELNE